MMNQLKILTAQPRILLWTPMHKKKFKAEIKYKTVMKIILLLQKKRLLIPRLLLLKIPKMRLQSSQKVKMRPTTLLVIPGGTYPMKTRNIVEQVGKRQLSIRIHLYGKQIDIIFSMVSIPFGTPFS